MSLTSSHSSPVDVQNPPATDHEPTTPRVLNRVAARMVDVALRPFFRLLHRAELGPAPSSSEPCSVTGMPVPLPPASWLLVLAWRYGYNAAAALAARGISALTGWAWQVTITCPITVDLDEENYQQAAADIVQALFAPGTRLVMSVPARTDSGWRRTGSAPLETLSVATRPISLPFGRAEFVAAATATLVVAGRDLFSPWGSADLELHGDVPDFDRADAHVGTCVGGWRNGGGRVRGARIRRRPVRPSGAPRPGA